MRLSGVGKYFFANNSACGFRDGNTVYKKAETIFTYLSGETFTVTETATNSFSNCVMNCIYESNVENAPTDLGAPIISPTTYSEPQEKGELCSPAEEFPEYWIGDFPITSFQPPFITFFAGTFNASGTYNFPYGGASIGLNGYDKTNMQFKWRFEHTFSATCYLKVWFTRRIRKYNYPTPSLDHLINFGSQVNAELVLQETQYEVLPYIYEWNPTETPCIGKQGDNDGGIINPYSGNNPYADVIAATGDVVKMNKNYPIIYGAEQTIEDPITYCPEPRTSADIFIDVYKYSFIREYEPENPSEGYPFAPDVSGRTKKNGFPVDGFN
jgi:hypothetical protein